MLVALRLEHCQSPGGRAHQHHRDGLPSHGIRDHVTLRKFGHRQGGHNHKHARFDDILGDALLVALA
jgi:hypothetical protein